jgi:hypothetical protein
MGLTDIEIVTAPSPYIAFKKLNEHLEVWILKNGWIEFKTSITYFLTLPLETNTGVGQKNFNDKLDSQLVFKRNVNYGIKYRIYQEEKEWYLNLDVKFKKIMGFTLEFDGLLFTPFDYKFIQGLLRKGKK